MVTGSTQPVSRRQASPRIIARRKPSPATRPGPERRKPRPATAEPSPLRLVGQTGLSTAGQATHRPGADPIQDVHDPRWVLAVRVAEKLEGPILRPEHRQQLVGLGRLLGLSVFDCNLVIAIVQDQARRGHEPAYCPTAGEDQLRMIPLPRRASFLATLRQRPALLVAGVLGTLILIELALLGWWL
ncbi:MAG: hypothetical protein WD534_15405 [Phycisphaeraceae bacterium]